LNADDTARSALRTLIFLLTALAAGMLYAQQAELPAMDPVSDAGYTLGPGDVVIITVHNHADLSGTFKLDGTGTVSMSLIGTIQAAGLTAGELERRIVDMLRPDYLVNPRVTVRVQNYRPYYIIGEVGRTGAFNYVQGMTYLTAIAIAGGYSYRAKKGVVFVIRGDDENREEIELEVHEKVQPGDIIRVAERLF
jgi:polysaccharide export outer membrane protein